MSSDRIKGEVVFTCDTCQDELETGVHDFAGANYARRDAGWRAKLTAGVWEHECPGCAGRVFD